MILQDGNSFNFYTGILGQPGNGKAGTCGRIGFEDFAVYGVDGLKIVHVGKEHRDFADVVNGGAGFSKHSLKVAQSLGSLVFDVVGNESAASVRSSPPAMS